MSSVLKYLLVYATSSFKFIFGPTLGAVYEFSILETGILTTLGMMTTVYLITYFGKQIRFITLRFSKPKVRKNNFSQRRRRFVKIWNRYGIQGIAFLTPLLLTPVGGAFLANALGAKRSDIIKWMWVFGAFWGFVLSALVKYAGDMLKDMNLL